MNVEAEVGQVINYFQVTEELATSGQPTEEQLLAIGKAGYDMVINLAPPTGHGAIANEGAIVSWLGMSYVQIPVEWEAPKLDELKLFADVMKAAGEKRVWVHCAMNMRVSCFVYLYRKHVLGLPEEEALYPMCKLWEPQGVWKQLVEQAPQVLE